MYHSMTCLLLNVLTKSVIKPHNAPVVWGDTGYSMVGHGAALSAMVLHGGPWYCMVTHGTAWWAMVLHGDPSYCMVGHVIHTQWILYFCFACNNIYFTPHFDLNCLLERWHTYGFSPLWMHQCLERLEEEKNPLWHRTLQVYGFSPVWVLICDSRLPGKLNFFWHP